MPGDVLIPDRRQMSMQAVTVNAGPEDIWPWLVQRPARWAVQLRLA
jgi:hypothetical protein